MPSPIRRTFRRVTALLLMLGFGLFSAETLIPDVHDGDAGLGHAPSVESLTAHSGGSGQPAGGSGEGSGHSVHVCHCVHAHTALGSVTAGPSRMRPHVTVPPIDAERRPLSAERDPQFRPPIA